MDTIKRSIQNSIATKQAILSNDALLARIGEVAQVMVKALRDGKRILWCGNGGSAADAQHLAAELSGRFYYDRPPLNSEALHCNTSYLTAVANDYGYDLIYSRMIDGACRPGDVLVGISTSGNSENLVLALEACRQKGIGTVALVGEKPCKMDDYDLVIKVPSCDTPRIQECQTLIGHIICDLVEKSLYNSESF